MEKGIDTSKWQNSKVDYAKAKQAGYSFVMLRVGHSNTKDVCFEKDYASAIAAGLKVGVYYYSYSMTVEQAKADATRVLGWLNNRHLDMPVVYDLEDATQKSTSRKTVNADMYNAFADVIKKSGYDTMLYTGEHFFNNYIDKSKITDKLWIARYSDTAPSVGRDIAMWQYTSSAISTDFYTEKLDRNYWYGETKDEEVKSTEDNEVIAEGSTEVMVQSYSKAKDGSKKLAQNFQVKEFACKDGSDTIFIAPELVTILQAIRSHFGKPVTINSAYRTPEYNKKVGGASQSQHCYGTAADIAVSGVTPKQVAAFAETLLYNRGGIGIYAGFTHIDVREVKSRWNG